MKRPLSIFTTAVTIFVFLGYTATTSAGVSIGVQKDDWIEYQVFPSGQSTEGHNVTWAKMEILEVKGTEIRANITTKAFNGTFTSTVETFDPAKGNVGIWFIIPANLKPGDSFFDAYIGRNVTVEGSEERIIAGATRTVTYASTPERIKRWDEATGVFVETIDAYSGETLYAVADKTNMWSAQTTGIDPAVFYLAILGAFAAGFVVAAIMLRVAHRRAPHNRSRDN